MIHHPTRLDLFRSLPPGSVGAEIGVCQGAFSIEILSCPNIAMLHLVDSWRARGGDYAADPCDAMDHEANLETTRRRINGLGLAARTQIHREDALGWMAWTPHRRLLDFIYLDADHARAAVFDQLLASTYLLKPGGVLMGHDYRTCPQSIRMGFGVVEAVAEFCARHPWRLTALALDEWPSYKLERA